LRVAENYRPSFRVSSARTYPRFALQVASMTRTRNDIRREMRARRRLVTASERSRAAHRFVTHAERAHLLRPGRRIAVYQPFGHEADVSALIRRAWQRHCIVYAPVVTHRRRFAMHFVPLSADARLAINAFGIAEPDHSPNERIPVLRLDVIFMPLVAFDARGWRLGSGAGFYDRCLRHLRVARQWRRPQLIGVAYEHQRVEALTPDPWDVPMDGVLTERRLYRFVTHTSGSAT
jgi:5-formyltetrahydrofolate cyclo-ligase